MTQIERMKRLLLQYEQLMNFSSIARLANRVGVTSAGEPRKAAIAQVEQKAAILRNQLRMAELSAQKRGLLAP